MNAGPDHNSLVLTFKTKLKTRLFRLALPQPQLQIAYNWAMVETFLFLKLSELYNVALHQGTL